MMEYQTIVRVGKNSVKVNFSGGSISNGCMQPARFSTKNLIIQNAIETSDEFMKGRIRLEKAIGLNEEIKVEKPASTIDNAQCTMPNQGDSGNLLSPEDKRADPEAETSRRQDEEQSVDSGERDSQEGELQEVEVSCKDVAKQYLQDHFNERPAPLRRWDDVQACAAKHGIIFKSPTLE